jgi:hypothetical protein
MRRSTHQPQPTNQPHRSARSTAHNRAKWEINVYSREQKMAHRAKNDLMVRATSETNTALRYVKRFGNPTVPMYICDKRFDEQFGDINHIIILKNASVATGYASHLATGYASHLATDTKTTIRETNTNNQLMPTAESLGLTGTREEREERMHGIWPTIRDNWWICTDQLIRNKHDHWIEQIEQLSNVLGNHYHELFRHTISHLQSLWQKRDLTNSLVRAERRRFFSRERSKFVMVGDSYFNLWFERLEFEWAQQDTMERLIDLTKSALTHSAPNDRAGVDLKSASIALMLMQTAQMAEMQELHHMIESSWRTMLLIHGRYVA